MPDHKTIFFYVESGLFLFVPQDRMPPTTLRPATMDLLSLLSVDILPPLLPPGADEFADIRVEDDLLQGKRRPGRQVRAQVGVRIVVIGSQSKKPGGNST